MKLWPHEPADIVIHGEVVEVPPVFLIDGILKSLPLWKEQGQVGDARRELERLRRSVLIEDVSHYGDLTSGLASAAVYSTLGIMDKTACQYCVDTLRELVP